MPPSRRFASRAEAPAPVDALRAVLLAGLLLATYPALVAVGAIALRRERFRLRTLVVVALALTGTLVAVGAGAASLDVRRPRPRARRRRRLRRLRPRGGRDHAPPHATAARRARLRRPAIALGGAGAATGQLTTDISTRGALLLGALTAVDAVAVAYRRAMREQGLG